MCFEIINETFLRGNIATGYYLSALCALWAKFSITVLRLTNPISGGHVAISLWHRCFILLQYLKQNAFRNLIMRVICFVLPDNSIYNGSSVNVMKTWQVPTAYMLLCPSLALNNLTWTPSWRRMINTRSNLKWFSIVKQTLIYSYLKWNLLYVYWYYVRWYHKRLCCFTNLQSQQQAAVCLLSKI